MLEKQIEAKVCKYAADKGLLHYKFSSPARRGVPDRLFVREDGLHFYIEFKREGEKPTPVQEREHAKLRGHKAAVFVIDNVEDGKRLIDQQVFYTSIGCKP